MSEFGGVVAVTCIALEARIARSAGVTVLRKPSSQLGPALEAAIANGATGVISFGIAGGLKPGLRAGTCVVASGVRTADRVIATDAAWSRRLMAAIPDALHGEVFGSDIMLSHPVQKQEIHASSGALAVDMESHMAAAAAAARGLPFVVCRAIVDPAWRSLPKAAMAGLRDDGTTAVLPVLRELARDPSQLGGLLRVAADAKAARQSLSAARRVLAASGTLFP